MYYYRNPTARTFRTTFRIHVKSTLMQPTTLSNCEPDEDINLISVDDGLSEKVPVEEELNSSSCSSLSLSSLSTIDASIFEQCEPGHEPQITLENCSNSYFAGYLAKKCTEKFKCNNCLDIVLKSDEDNTFNQQEFLIFCRNYDSQSSDLFLKRPTSSFTEFISLAQKIIKKTVEKMPHKRLIQKCIFNKIKNDLSHVCKFSKSCQDHYHFIIVHLIHCKLLRDFNWKSKNIKKNRAEKSKNKLNILKNN